MICLPCFVAQRGRRNGWLPAYALCVMRSVNA
nr:MAG TPA: hypothetical protein [Caudoviricetes sp.]